MSSGSQARGPRPAADRFPLARSNALEELGRERTETSVKLETLTAWEVATAASGVEQVGHDCRCAIETVVKHARKHARNKRLILRTPFR
jgi:hypothetical protein